MSAEEKLMKNAKQHTVYKNFEGKRVPSVTTILGVMAKPNLIKWANTIGLEGVVYEDYLKETAKAGTLGHELIQEYIGGLTFSPDLSKYTQDQISSATIAFNNFKQWMAEKDIEPLNIELQLTSDFLEYGGTLDLYAKIKNEYWLVDFKTGKGIYPEYISQVAAYKQLLEEKGMQVDGARILRMGRQDDGGFEDYVIPMKKLDRAWDVFECCLDLYKAKQRLERKGE